MLEDVQGPEATYQIKGTEGYVRAKIQESDGNAAWTQPVMRFDGTGARGRARRPYRPNAATLVRRLPR